MRSAVIKKVPDKRKAASQEDPPSDEIDKEVVQLGSPIDYSKYSRRELQVLAKQYTQSLRLPLTSKTESLYRALRNVGALPGGSISMKLWFPDNNVMNLVFSKLSDNLLINFKDRPYLDYIFWNNKFKERYGVELHRDSPEDWALIRHLELHATPTNLIRDSYQYKIFTLADRGYLDYFEKIDPEAYHKDDTYVINKYSIVEGLINYAVKSNSYTFLQRILDFVEKEESDQVDDEVLSSAFNIGAGTAVSMPYTTNEIIGWLDEFMRRGSTSLDEAVKVAIKEHKIAILEHLFKVGYSLLFPELRKSLRGVEDPSNDADMDRVFFHLLNDSLVSGHMPTIKIVWNLIIHKDMYIDVRDIIYYVNAFMADQPSKNVCKLIKLLGSRIPKIYDTLIVFDDSYKDPQLIDLLLKHIDIEKYSAEILIKTIKWNNKKVVDLILASGFKLRQYHIDEALRRHHYELAKDLTKVLSKQEKYK